jgi:endoglucanase
VRYLAAMLAASALALALPLCSAHAALALHHAATHSCRSASRAPTSVHSSSLSSTQIKQDHTALAREQHLLKQAERHPLPVEHNAIRNARRAISKLEAKLACVSIRPPTVRAHPKGSFSNRPEATTPPEATTSPSLTTANPSISSSSPPVLSAPIQLPVPEASPVPEAPAPGLSIAVSGNHLVDGSGAPVTLHGVDISSTEWQCLYGQAFESPSNEASIAAIAAWHANAVRIPLNEDCWLGINGAPTNIAAYHEAIASYVDRLHAHGLYAILDLHWNAPGTILSHWGNEYAGFYEMADESHTPAFWSSIATYFATDHAVLFDLYNEPAGISWNCWREGCIAPRGYQTAGMQQLVNVIRATGATQPIMVAGLSHASLDGQEWLNYHPNDPAKQLVASVHVYDQDIISHFNTNIGTVAAQFPVVAGETGETDCVDNTIHAFLPWADAHGVSYLAWAWFTGKCASYPALISNYNGTPTPYGIGYREHLLANFPAPSP